MSSTASSEDSDIGSTSTAPRGRWYNARVLAAVLGFLGAGLALISGLLPVHQNNAEINWAPGADFTSVTAPLVSGRAVDLDVRIPCAAAAEADGMRAAKR